MRIFRSRMGALEADGLVPGTNYVTTKSGATMNSDIILEALRVQEEKKKEEEEAKVAAACRRELKEIYPENEKELAHLIELASARKRRRENARWRRRNKMMREMHGTSRPHS